MAGFIGFSIGLLFVLMLANGFFAASEIAIVSARRSRLQQQADAGQKSAQQALKLAENPDRFLATVQIGITLISTLAAAFGEKSLSEPIAQWLHTIPLLAPYASTLSLIIVVVSISYFSLILGELVPKRLALQGAEKLAIFAAPFMDTLSKIARPAVSFLTLSANLVLRLLGQNKATQSMVTAEDIVYLAREGIASGTVENVEGEIIHRVFRFTDRQISNVMKPRTEIVAIEAGADLEAAIETFLDSGYTRLPLYEGSLDNIIGILYAKDLLRARRSEESVDLKEIARPAFFVSEYQHVDDLLNTFRRKGIHLAVVIDEYSQVIGLITLEDLLEELVGEIQDEYDEPESTYFVQREDGSWLIDAMADQELAREKLGMNQLPEDERGEYQTVAGMMLAHMGRIPTVGESTTINGFIFEVVDMDGRRIDKVLVRPQE